MKKLKTCSLFMSVWQEFTLCEVNKLAAEANSGSLFLLFCTTEGNSDSSSRVNASHDPDPARYQTQQFQRKFTESMIHTEGINKSLQFISLGFLDQIEIEHYDNANSTSCIPRSASFPNIQKNNSSGSQAQPNQSQLSRMLYHRFCNNG